MLQEQQRLYGALFALRILTRKYEFKDEEERAPLGTLVDATFPILLRIFQARSQCLHSGISDCLFMKESAGWRSPRERKHALSADPNQVPSLLAYFKGVHGPEVTCMEGMYEGETHAARGTMGACPCSPLHK